MTPIENTGGQYGSRVWRGNSKILERLVDTYEPTSAETGTGQNRMGKKYLDYYYAKKC